MKLLLHTYTLVWWLEGDPRLPAKVRTGLESMDCEVLIGVGCLWEIVIKISLGKLVLETPLD